MPRASPFIGHEDLGCRFLAQQVRPGFALHAQHDPDPRVDVPGPTICRTGPSGTATTSMAMGRDMRLPSTSSSGTVARNSRHPRRSSTSSRFRPPPHTELRGIAGGDALPHAAVAHQHDLALQVMVRRVGRQLGGGSVRCSSLRASSKRTISQRLAA